MTTKGYLQVGGASLVCVLAASATAQETEKPQPTGTPEQSSAQIGSDAPRVTRRKLQSWAPLTSPDPAIGGLIQQVESGYAPIERLLIPEGSQLPPTRGTPVRIPSGEWVFVFHKDEGGKAPTPMVMLPCPMLEQMEHEIERQAKATPDMARSGSVAFLVGGQVQFYKGRNYLLATSMIGLRDTKAAAANTLGGHGAPDDANAQGNGEPVEPDGAPMDPDVAELFEELRGARDLQRPMAGVPPLADGETRDATSTPLPTDTAVTRMTGRVERAGGVLVFRSDNDAESLETKSFILLPCSNLAGIEQIALYRGTGVSITMSGRALSYRRQMFLLPTMYQVARMSDMTPMQ